MKECSQLSCMYNTLKGCVVDEHFGIYPLSNTRLPDVPATDVGKTNADHIRSMTDEELAEYLYDRVGIAAEHIAYCENNPECELMLEADVDIPDVMCKECLCRWLKHPFKEDT